MSGKDDEVGGPRRDALGRYVKGRSGNPAGRPHRKRRLDVPSQLGRDVLDFSRVIVTFPGPNGPRKLSRQELLLEALFASAMKGKASSQKLWIELMKIGREELVKRHPGVGLAELMRQMYEDPTADHDPGLREAVDEWIRRMKRL